MTDLTQIAETVAVELLGWHRTLDGWGHESFPKWMWPHVKASYLLTGNGMLEIIEAMRERGEYVQIHSGKSSLGNYSVRFSTTTIYMEDTLPEAVLRAAYAALEGRELDREHNEL